MPKVSVIIPVYNAEKYLRECLDSVINQTLKDIEIICVNDGSTDNSLKILEEYAQNDHRIKVISQENQGVSVARNKGILLSKGNFVCFIDSDDLYPNSDSLELLFVNAMNNNVLISGGELCQFDSNICPYVLKFDNKKYLFDHEGIVYFNDYQFSYGFTRFIYNREFLIDNNILFPNYSQYEDPVFLVKALLTAKKFYAVKKCCYAYRHSHKLYTLSIKNTEDAIRGILDNLNIANKYKFNVLKNDTLKNFDYFNQRSKKIRNFKTKMLIIYIRIFYKKYNFKEIIQNIFSIKNSQDKKHKVITLLGIKFKFERCNKNV